jgi:hypothetical protein
MSRVVAKSGEPVGPAVRGYISDKLKLQVLVANGGRCCNPKCGKKLVRGDTQFDHVLSVFLGGLTEVGNLECLCVACHAAKTKTDAGKHAKVKRLQANNLPPSDDIVETKPRRNAIQNSGFDRSKTRRFDGKVVAREARP